MESLSTRIQKAVGPLLGSDMRSVSVVPVSGNTTLRVWLVDDQEEYLPLQAHLLNLEPGLRCERQFCSAEAVLLALKKESAPDAILLDIDMPKMNGVDAIRPILQLAPTTCVLMQTTFFDPRLKDSALAAGASDFLLKRDATIKTVAAIRAATNRKSALANPSPM